jgi:hypothetical protein
MHAAAAVDVAHLQPELVNQGHVMLDFYKLEQEGENGKGKNKGDRTA